MREATRVENSGGISASLQGRYASALFDLASEGGSVSAVEADLDSLGEAVRQSGDLAALIRNPRVTREAAAKAIDAVAGVLGLSQLTKNFLGTYNYETNKWNATGLSPDHDINMPFTRLLAGPADYHLGGFRAVPSDKFKTQHYRPLMAGTRCHMLAMYVVLESYLAMVCDYPAAYEGQPGFKFIEDVPTTWDETVVPAAKLHEYVTIARRKGADWFIGTINNTKAKAVELPLSFLPTGNYTAEIYSDAEDTEQNPNHLSAIVKTVSNTDTIIIQLAAGGGHAIRLVHQ